VRNGLANLYAQNILQLFAQFRDAGFSLPDQALLTAAHRLAADLFSGQTRGPGKPFIEHLVATASILVTYAAPVPVVAAGILHAAYDQGDFGVGLLGRHSRKKAEMLRVVGPDVEEYVQQYHALRWSRDYIGSLSSTVRSLSDHARHVVLIRLANELEEHVDCAIQFCANAEERLARMDALGPALVSAAHAIAQPELAAELDRAFLVNRTTRIPELARSNSAYSYVRPPRSYARRWTARVRSAGSPFSVLL